MLTKEDFWQLGKYIFGGLGFLWLALELKRIEYLLLQILVK